MQLSCQAASSLTIVAFSAATGVESWGSGATPSMLRAPNAVHRTAARYSKAAFEFALAVLCAVRESFVLLRGRCKAPKSRETSGMQHLRPGNDEFKATIVSTVYI